MSLLGDCGSAGPGGYAGRRGVVSPSRAQAGQAPPKGDSFQTELSGSPKLSNSSGWLT